MPHFTPDQLLELATFFGLKPAPKVTSTPPKMSDTVLPVKDGIVLKSEKIWWRCEEGPMHVHANEHWKNIFEFPNIYSHAIPVVSKVIYKD